MSYKLLINIYWMSLNTACCFNLAKFNLIQTEKVNRNVLASDNFEIKSKWLEQTAV